MAFFTRGRLWRAINGSSAEGSLVPEAACPCGQALGVKTQGVWAFVEEGHKGLSKPPLPMALYTKNLPAQCVSRGSLDCFLWFSSFQRCPGPSPSSTGREDALLPLKGNSWERNVAFHLPALPRTSKWLRKGQHSMPGCLPLRGMSRCTVGRLFFPCYPESQNCQGRSSTLFLSLLPTILLGWQAIEGCPGAS